MGARLDVTGRLWKSLRPFSAYSAGSLSVMAMLRQPSGRGVTGNILVSLRREVYSFADVADGSCMPGLNPQCREESDEENHCRFRSFCVPVVCGRNSSCPKCS